MGFVDWLENPTPWIPAFAGMTMLRYWGSSLMHELNPMDPRLAVPRNFFSLRETRLAVPRNFFSLRETRLAVPRNFVSLRETRFHGDDDAAVHGCCVGARALQRHRGRVVGWQSGWKSPDGWPDS